MSSHCVFVSAAMHLHYGDMTDSTCLVKIVNQVLPTEVYNLAAQSHVKVGCMYTRAHAHTHTHTNLMLTYTHTYLSVHKAAYQLS